MHVANKKSYYANYICTNKVNFNIYSSAYYKPLIEISPIFQNNIKGKQKDIKYNNKY